MTLPCPRQPFKTHWHRRRCAAPPGRSFHRGAAADDGDDDDKKKTLLRSSLAHKDAVKYNRRELNSRRGVKLAAHWNFLGVSESWSGTAESFVGHSTAYLLSALLV